MSNKPPIKPRGATPMKSKPAAKPAAKPRSATSKKKPVKATATNTTTSTPRGAEHSNVGMVQRIKSWASSHLNELVSSLQSLLQQWVNSALIWAVIGITLALPLSLGALLNNMELLTSGWDGGSRISLYLSADAEPKQVLSKVEALDSASAAQLISKQQGLDDFKSASGFGEILDLLEVNPLPDVVVFEPIAEDLVGIEHIAQQLSNWPEIESVQVDMEWMHRLQALTHTLERGVWLLAAILGLAVMLISGNTLRMVIEARRSEIVVVKLVGGSDAYVRRPFLYAGLWYGLGGGITALILVNVALLIMKGSVQTLLDLYSASATLVGPTAIQNFGVLIVGAGLGLAGAWLAVARHLGEIEPK